MITNEQLQNNRHSLAHLMAAAVMKLWPDTKRTIGPAVENGFYFDFEFSKPITDADLKDIEKTMRKILPTWDKFERFELTADEAKKEYPGNQYKHELIDEFTKDGQKVTFYKSGDYWDLCKGGHAESMKDVPADCFKLDKIAGAYWRGSEKNAQLTRIYGLAFATKADLDAYITQQEEAEKRDHRKLGMELDLFHFDESIGKGLPIWLPKGNIIKEELENWAKHTEREWGYQRVTTPIITKEDLFYTSGHLPLYKDSMYAPIQIEEENFYIKPMNCPFHHKAFGARPRSYRELPLRLAEYGWCHRYEDSGSLFGMMRVRGMQMNDAHIYVQKENAVEEFLKVIKLHEYYYQKLGIKDYEMELALRDPNKMDKYHGDEQDWQDAEKMTIEAMEQSGVPYKVVHEGAAFYGPKMDFQIKSSIGRTFTASTNQLDLYMGKRFGLEYIDKDGQKKTPAVIHRAPLGTHERFIGFLIEHFAGNFPLWLSPVQAALLPISEKQHDYIQKVAAQIKSNLPDLRLEIDDRNESIGKRIREATKQKVPYILVAGDKEIESNSLAVRKLDGTDLGAIPVEELIKKLSEEINEKK